MLIECYPNGNEPVLLSSKNWPDAFKEAQLYLGPRAPWAGLIGKTEDGEFLGSIRVYRSGQIDIVSGTDELEVTPKVTKPRRKPAGLAAGAAG